MVMTPQPPNERDFELLLRLDERQTRLEAINFSGGATPHQIGGKHCTDHSARLRKLATKGLVRTELRRSEVHPRGSRRYWITEEGRQALAEWREKQAVDEPVD